MSPSAALCCSYLPLRNFILFSISQFLQYSFYCQNQMVLRFRKICLVFVPLTNSSFTPMLALQYLASFHFEIKPFIRANIAIVFKLPFYFSGLIIYQVNGICNLLTFNNCKSCFNSLCFLPTTTFFAISTSFIMTHLAPLLTMIFIYKLTNEVVLVDVQQLIFKPNVGIVVFKTQCHHMAIFESQIAI